MQSSVPEALRAPTRRTGTWKWIAGGVALTLLTLAGALMIRAQWRLSRRYDPPLAAVATGPELRARGEHLSHTYGCRHCHGDDLGGKLVEDSPLMRITGPNLTPASSVVGSYQPRDWARALLHGVSREGRPLLLMPAHHLRVLSDQDVAALATYLADCPPVRGDQPPSEVRLIGQLLLGAGADLIAAEHIDQSRVRAPVQSVSERAGPAYGAYLARACAGCHGADLQGGPAVGPPGTPAPPAIAGAAIQGWTEAEFVRALRQGKGRDGRSLNPMMPWEALRHLRDDEINALWLVLRNEGRPVAGR